MQPVAAPELGIAPHSVAVSPIPQVQVGPGSMPELSTSVTKVAIEGSDVEAATAAAGAAALAGVPTTDGTGVVLVGDVGSTLTPRAICVRSATVLEAELVTRAVDFTEEWEPATSSGPPTAMTTRSAIEAAAAHRPLRWRATLPG